MLKFFKGDPSKYIIKYVGGKIKKKGLGISFYYFDHNSSVISIPATTTDFNFIFNETTKNFQKISIQGHLTYKIKDPLKMALLLNFEIYPKDGNYISEDPEKLELRIKNVIQMITRKEIKILDLEEVLAINTILADKVFEQTPNSSLLQEMGIEVLSITFNSVTPTPEISKALEADYRESLQRKSDEAIYTRRAAAVEQERKIRENELNTQITLEEKKKTLINLNGKNTIEEAEFLAQAKALELGVYKDMDPRIVLALALKELSENANKIGSLTITSEILSSLLNK